MQMTVELETSILETVPDTSQSDPCEMLQESDLLAGIEDWLDELSTKHKKVLTRRFRVGGHSIGA